MKAICISGMAAMVLSLGAIPAAAQPVISAKSGTIAWVEGKVYLGDELVQSSQTKFPDVKENGVVRTEEGRAEVLLTPGVVLHLGENSSFRLITNRLVDTRLELLTGSAVVDAEEVAKDTNVTLVCKNAAVALPKAGHYRFDADPGRLKVFAGTADVKIGDRHIEVAAGKMLSLTGDVASAEKFDKNDTDSLDNWARQRGQVMALANVSAARSMSYASAGSSVGMWGWNPYFGIYTYIPGSGRFCDPFYGFCYWSPRTVYQVYYQPPAMPTNFGGGYNPGGYATMGGTSSGYSGTMAASSASAGVSSSPAASMSAGSSAASSAGAGSVGHGGGASGGHGK